ncbi:MAG: hypothetical protein ACO3LE_10855 [Bdellovibrionota bacterium]
MLESELRSNKKSYPYLVIRYMAAVYRKKVIRLRGGEADFVSHDAFFEIAHPEVVSAFDHITSAVRDFATAHLIEFAKSNRFLMCVVWSETECTYLEPDGYSYNSSSIPSGGLVI